MRALTVFMLGANVGFALAVLTAPAGRAPVVAAASTAPVVVGKITKTSPISMEIRGPAKQMLRRNEGEHAKVYTDSEGNPTIGVGFNLTRPDVAKRLRAVKTTKARMLAGELLSDSQIDWLLDADLTDVLQDLVTLFPRFDEMPIKAQFVLIDLRFNCGPAGLRTFVNTLTAFKTAQWNDAAERLASSQWAEQVGDRADRAINMLRGIS